MPNQRAPGTSLLVIPIPRALKKEIAEIAAEIAKKSGTRASSAAWVRKVIRDTIRRSRSAKKAAAAK